MAASVNTSVQDQNCCFWVKHSEGCAQVKQGGAAIVAALAAIVLVGGALLILAQQGFDLAGINSIANMVEAKWIYLGMGITGAVVLIDVTFILAQVHSYLNKTVSKEELTNQGLFKWLTEDHTIAQLHPRSFTTVAARECNQYIIVSKDENGSPSYIAYHTQEDLDFHQARLMRKGYESLQDLQANSREHRAEYVEELIGSTQLQKWKRDLSQGLEVGYYRSSYETIYCTNQIKAWPLAVHDDTGIHLRFFHTEEARQDVINTQYDDLRDLGEINHLALKEYETQVQVTLQANQYWAYQAELGRHQPIYFVAYPSNKGVTIQHFFEPELRTQFIKARFSDENNAQVKFGASPTYLPQELEYLTAQEDISSVLARVVAAEQYEKIDVPMLGRENLWIYALKVAGNPSATIYFKTARLRRDHINENLKGFFNAGLIRREENKAQIHLALEALENEGDYFTLPIAKDIVCIYYFSKEGIKKQPLTKGGVDLYKETQLLKQNILDGIAESGQYPKRLGQALARGITSADFSEPGLLERIGYLSKGEYTSWPPQATTSSRFPNLYILTVKQQDTGATDCFYFGTEQARSAFYKSQGLQNGYARYNEQQICVNITGFNIYHEQAENKKPLLFTFQSPDEETTTFVTYDNGKIETRFIPTAKMEAELEGMKVTHLYFSKELLAKRPLSTDEVNYLEREISSAPAGSLSISAYWFISDNGLQPKQYVACKVHGGYVALLVRHKETDNAQYETYYFRNNAPAYLEHLQELAAYKNAEAQN